LNWPAGDREPTLKQTGGRQGKKGIARTGFKAESRPCRGQTGGHEKGRRRSPQPL